MSATQIKVKSYPLIKASLSLLFRRAVLDAILQTGPIRLVNRGHVIDPISHGIRFVVRVVRHDAIDESCGIT